MKSKVEDVVTRLLSEGCTGAIASACPGDDGEIESSYVQYTRSGNVFSPVGHITLVSKLQEFAYRVQNSMGGPYFEKVRPKTDELLAFPSSPMQLVLEEIEKFWGLKDNFNKLGFLHNRGILVYGPPGTGKSCLMQQVAESMVRQGDVLFFAKSLSPVESGLAAFRQIEPDRKVVVVLEDLDEYLHYSERDLLQLLDGDNSVDNVVFLGSTNYLEKFPPRLLRPGRFDKRVFVGPPPVEGRLVYLRHKLSDVEDDATISRIAEQTKGLSFGHLRELVIAAYAFREPLDEVMKRLHQTDTMDLPEREERRMRLLGGPAKKTLIEMKVSRESSAKMAGDLAQRYQIEDWMKREISVRGGRAGRIIDPVVLAQDAAEAFSIPGDSPYAAHPVDWLIALARQSVSSLMEPESEPASEIEAIVDEMIPHNSAGLAGKLAQRYQVEDWMRSEVSARGGHAGRTIDAERLARDAAVHFSIPGDTQYSEYPADWLIQMAQQVISRPGPESEPASEIEAIVDEMCGKTHKKKKKKKTGYAK